MLMFITQPSGRYSIPEEVQMALEGGCRWIQLRLDDATDEEFRQVASEVIPLCKESDAYLVFDNRVDLAIEMGVHGVVLGQGGMDPLMARDVMGPEAIIGVTAASVEEIMRFKGRDIDYVELSADPMSAIDVDVCRDIMQQVRQDGFEPPVAATGDITVDDIPSIMSTGVNGIAMGKAIVNAPDPVAYTERVLEVLSR